MTLTEALAGIEIREDIREHLVLLDIPFYSFEGVTKVGQMVVHEHVADDVQKIFKTLYGILFPIEHMIPIVAFHWDDNASMAANNTSCFNYRLIEGTDRLSNHSYGVAVDVNPMQNPYVRRDGLVLPKGASYNPGQKGTVTGEIASVFSAHGWEWGGTWDDPKDWQHFQKPQARPLENLRNFL
jgi:peptidoglycan L-alanyl-D-glutamate endopeptidase CwlK